MGVVTGWGQTSNSSPSKNLIKLEVPIINKTLCEDSYKSIGGSSEEQNICAGFYGEVGKDICPGDTGAPLIVGGKLVAIASWSNGCGEPQFPGLYTENSKLIRFWINQMTGI